MPPLGARLGVPVPHVLGVGGTKQNFTHRLVPEISQRDEQGGEAPFHRNDLFGQTLAEHLEPRKPAQLILANRADVALWLGLPRGSRSGQVRDGDSSGRVADPSGHRGHGDRRSGDGVDVPPHPERLRDVLPGEAGLEAGSHQKITPAGPQRLPILNHTDPGQPAFQVHSHQHSDGPIESDGLWGEVGGEEDVAHQRFASARRVHPESAEDGGGSFLGREALRRRHHVPEQLRRNLPTLLTHDVHRPESCHHHTEYRQNLENSPTGRRHPGGESVHRRPTFADSMGPRGPLFLSRSHTLTEGTAELHHFIGGPAGSKVMGSNNRRRRDTVRELSPK